jgi:hypothetical protein
MQEANFVWSCAEPVACPGVSISFNRIKEGSASSRHFWVDLLRVSMIVLIWRGVKIALLSSRLTDSSVFRSLDQSRLRRGNITCIANISGRHQTYRTWWQNRDKARGVEDRLSCRLNVHGVNFRLALLSHFNSEFRNRVHPPDSPPSTPI